MRLGTGVNDQYIYFVAVDSSTGARKTGLSSFTVYRSRNGAAAVAYTTPTINETDATNMPGVYELLVDEDVTLDAGDVTQEIALHITATGMLPITRVIELFRPPVSAGETLTVTSGRANADMTHIATAAVNTSSAQLGVNVVNAAGTAWNSGAITGSTLNANTGLTPIRANTAQAGAAGTITLDASASATTDFYKGLVIYVSSGTGAGQARLITAYNGTTKVATVVPNWVTNPASGSGFVIEPWGPADLRAILGAAVSTTTAQLGVNLVNIAGSAVNTASAQLGVNVVNAGGTAWASGSIVAGAFAQGAADKVWSTAARTLTAGTNIVLAKGTGITGFNDISSSDVNTVMTTLGLDHLISASVTGTDVADNSIVARLVSKSATADWDTFSNQTDSLEALRDRGDAAWITATGFSTLTANDVWTHGTRVLTAGTNIVLAKGTGVTGFNDLSAAQVNAEVDTALSDIGLDHLLAASVTGTDVTDNSIIARMVSKSATADWDTYNQTTDSLEALRDRGDAAWITATGFSTHTAADVWAVGTRRLTDGTNIVLAKGVGVTGFNDLSAAQVNAEAGTALVDAGVTPAVMANLDATISSRLAAASYTSPPTVNAIADGLLDRTAGIEGNLTLREGLRLMVSVLLGKVSGGNTASNVFRDYNDTKDRVTATVDADGNRTAITYDKS